MLHKILEPEEYENLLRQHKTEHDGRIKDRIKAVLLYDQFVQIKDIARVLFICSDTAGDYIKYYQKTKRIY